MNLDELELPSPHGEPLQADPGQLTGIDLHAQHASDRTGGDLFDTVQIGSRVSFLLSDIAGKRPELDPIAADMQRVFRVTSEQVFSAASVNLMEAAETLILTINHALIAIMNGVRFAPTFVGCYDVPLGILAYINAGGQTAIIRDSENTRALPNASMPLGLFTHLTYDASIQAFEPGAVLLVATKGVTEGVETTSPSGDQKIIDLLQAFKHESAEDICAAIFNTAHPAQQPHRNWLPFKAKPKQDDMTVFAMRRTV